MARPCLTNPATRSKKRASIASEPGERSGAKGPRERASRGVPGGEAPRTRTVYLVGAGPGDPGLLTVRALELIRRADVVLHDHLVSAEVLGECNAAAQLIDVGKIGHGRQCAQDDIESRLIACARAGLAVVRLKGGDPLLFGRGAEEAAALRGAGIPFEIVPGVSSALAAPAYAGIPLTARGVASSVAIVTGHCADAGRLPLAIPAADTIVVLMGLANAAGLRDTLMADGRPGDMPVAIVEWGTLPHQRVEVGTLDCLPDLIERAGLEAPAVIVIGETVNLRAILNWREADATRSALAAVGS
jgi:uroporphyrin-III C-methyltransferase